ncbi:MAG: histidine kinase, partial [Comamonadaceae bacterium]
MHVPRAAAWVSGNVSCPWIWSAERVGGAVVPRLLSSKRASATFALTVFVTTVVQVLATPFTALLGGTSEWGLLYPEPVIVTLLVVGCALQAAALTLSDRWPRTAVVLTVAVYLTLVVWLSVPSWLVGMYLVIALAMFLLATRLSPAESIVWAVTVSAVSVALLLWWILAIGTEPRIAVGYVVAEAARLAAPTLAGAALGIWWSAQVRRVTLAREDAELARQEHDMRVAAAESRERARIAQELHDVAGQHLAGLITLSEAALAISPTQPEEALQLVRDLRDEGRFAAAS